MSHDEEKQLADLVGYILTGITFGFWMKSYWAGFFMMCACVTISIFIIEGTREYAKQVEECTKKRVI